MKKLNEKELRKINGGLIDFNIINFISFDNKKDKNIVKEYFHKFFKKYF
ncbi:bacteriocin [Lactobacillus kalixensis]|nr:bacteriocin [Lactobacillus kalixensis]